MDMEYKRLGCQIKTREGTKGYDVILLLRNGEDDRVEEKFRDRERDDLLIELLQDIGTPVLGWFYTTRCDHLHYVMGDGDAGNPIAYYRIPWEKFKRWLIEDCSKRSFGKYQLSRRGIGLTLNFVIPICDVPEGYCHKLMVGSS